MEKDVPLSKEDRFHGIGTEFINYFIVQSVLNILINGSVFIVIVWKRELRKTLSNIVIANFLLTLVFMNLLSVLYNSKLSSFKVVTIQTAVLPFFIALMVMAIDRFLCIRFPFRYEIFSYKKSIILITCVIWSPIVIGFPTTLAGELNINGDLTEIVVTISTMVILVIANTYVYTVSVCHIRKISLQKTGCKSSRANWRETTSSGIWRSLLISFLLTATFIIGFTTHLVIRILQVTGQISLRKELWLNRINYPILCMKGMVYPIICVVLNKSLRKAVFVLICRTKYAKRKH